MTKVQVELTQHELWLCIEALEAKAEAASDSWSVFRDPGERHDLETEEVECRELQERLEALREQSIVEEG